MFTQQFKIILWKNWKIFKQRFSIFFSAFEIFFTFLVIATFSGAVRKESIDLEEIPFEEAISFSSYLEEGQYIAFVLPKSSNVDVDGDTFISHVMDYPDLMGVTYKIFSSEKELEQYVYVSIGKNSMDKSFMCAVVFYDDYTNYAIRFRGTSIPNPSEEPVWDFDQSTSPNESFGYANYFMPVQMAVDNAIIEMKTNYTVHGISARISSLPRPSINNPKIERKLEGLAPYLILLCIGQFFHICNRLMDEVEDRSKEGLISIGANPFHLWFTWEIIYLPLSFIIFFIFLVFDPSNIIGVINPILFVLYYLFYVISMYNIAVIVSLFLRKSEMMLVFIMVFMASIISINKFIFELKINGHESIEKVVSALFSPVGVSMGCEEILYEANKKHYIGFTNLFQSKFGFYFVSAFLDMFAYIGLAVLLEWLRKVDFRSIGISKSKMKKNMNSNYQNDIQEDPTDSECYVEVKNIYKYFRFRRGFVTDVDDNDKHLGRLFAANNNISFKVYKDEIFAILGHNGAGKSTLIQNMVGIIKPNHGETYYGGLPFSKHKKEIRQQFGICLQSNILIKGFTVADHFKLYSGIKGVSETDFDRWIKEIDLVGKEHYDVHKMSGGQKRKLCIGLALIGNPKYVFLDEPTTGLDPLSRRKIWNLLLKIKKDRVIFITTHYMDEADIIADRKLILRKGIIRCLGSSVYLKNHFQMKYNLEVETSQVSAIDEIIKQYVPDAFYYQDKTDVDTNSSAFIHMWKLPVTASDVFSTLLSGLEKERGHLLKNFSLNAPLLEELFIALDRESEGQKEDHSVKVIELPKIEKVSRPGVLRMALRLSRYRIRVYLRNKTYWFMGIFIPVAVLVAFLPGFKLSIMDFEKVEFSASLYKDQQWNYDIQHSNIVDKITPQIIQEEIPKHSDLSGSMDTLTIEQISEKGMAMSANPYYVSSFSGNYVNDTYQFDIYTNATMVHALPSTINMLNNAVLASEQLNDTIHLYSFPFLEGSSSVKILLTLVISFCFAFPLSLYGTNVVRERVQKLLKQLQLNGIANRSYWLSVLFSDHIVFMITCVLILLTFVICKFTVFIHTSMLILLFIYIFICGIAYILFQYCVSYIFNKDRNIFFLFFLINIVPLFSVTMYTYNIKMDSDSADAPIDAQLYLGSMVVFIGSIFPSYAFVKVFRNLIEIGISHLACSVDISIPALLGIDHQIIFCFISAFISIGVYGYLLVKLTRRKYNPRNMVFETTEEKNRAYDKELKESDDDIQKEYQRVLDDQTKHHIPIKMLKLSKEYDEISFDSKQEILDAMKRENPKYGEYHMSTMGSGRVVVTPFENISFGVDRCECFGILGPNGSGKTSLLNTASFIFPQTLGKIYYDGKDTTERVGNEISLGYCPQEDTLWNQFTLFEHIEMFLYLRGYSKRKAKRIAKEFIHYCQLSEHKNKKPNEMSGGTRRKLNILIALCCSSSKIIMDEPTAGMDPSTRRYIWDIIKDSIQSNKSSIVMSTHSMEEAELLCNRIAIMIKGHLKCIGTPEHLKMKFGNTYILDVHSNDVEKFHQDVVVNGKLFEEGMYTREDKSSHRVKYEVRNMTMISSVFEKMEACRLEGLVTDYSYSQTSLEQVFLNFAKEAHQDEMDEDEVLMK